MRVLVLFIEPEEAYVEERVLVFIRIIRDLARAFHSEKQREKLICIGIIFVKKYYRVQ